MGVLGIYRDAVTVINRADHDLVVRYDGEDIILKPGPNAGFPAVAVPYAKKQNPLMGSKHPLNPLKFISLIGVEGKDDCTPIPVDVLRKAEKKLEVIDRSGEYHNRPQRQNMKVLNPGFEPYDAGIGFEDGAVLGDSNSALDAKLG